MSKDIKPIFTIGIPNTIEFEERTELTEKLTKDLPEYYIITYPIEANEAKFECFNSDNFTDINFEELKKLINENRK